MRTAAYIQAPLSTGIEDRLESAREWLKNRGIWEVKGVYDQVCCPLCRRPTIKSRAGYSRHSGSRSIVHHETVVPEGYEVALGSSAGVGVGQ